MYKIHDEKMDKGKIRLISFISFLVGFAQALFIYIISTYFKEASGTENVGPFYFVAYSIVLIFLFNLHKAIKVLGRSNVFFFIILFKIISVVFLLVLPPSILSIIMLMIFIILGSLEWASLDVILESFSLDNMSGRIRGKHLMVVNLGFLIGPLISSRVIENFGYGGIFFVLVVVNCFMLAVSILGLRNTNEKFERSIKILTLIKKVYKRKNIMKAYGVSFALEFFYALAIIYVPIHLLNLGMGWDKIGWVFTAMLLPFVILQYPLGFLADKKTGEKEFMILALLITGVSAGVIYFIATPNVFIWSLVLFSTRIGAATLEVMRDSYFYKRIDKNDVDVISFFRTSQPVAYILSAASAFLIFEIFSENAIRLVFILVAAVLLFSIYPAWKLEDNKSECELCTK